MAAVGVVDAADLDDGAAALDARRLVVEQAHAAVLDDARVRGLHERRLAVAVVVVAEHAEDAERRAQARAAGAAARSLPCGPPAKSPVMSTRSGSRGERQVDGLARGAQVEAGREARVEVGELHDDEAVERRVGVRRRQAPVDAAHPLRLVQQIGEAEGGGPGDRGRRPQPVAREPAQVSVAGRRAGGAAVGVLAADAVAAGVHLAAQALARLLDLAPQRLVLVGGRVLAGADRALDAVDLGAEAALAAAAAAASPCRSSAPAAGRPRRRRRRRTGTRRGASSRLRPPCPPSRLCPPSTSARSVVLRYSTRPHARPTGAA